MNLSMASEREHAPMYRLVRLLLLALVGAGVIGMHVLSEHGPGGGHGMVMDATIPAASMAQPASAARDHQAMDMHMGPTGPSVAAFNSAPDTSTVLGAPANPGWSGSMAMCLLFLTAGAIAIALMLLAHRARRRSGDVAVRLNPGWSFSRRGPPPLSLPLPHSLCILRV
ncbi:hypothetical protein ABIB25_005275 [Nakamurella sp. UYEF19]|uniref:hypothetical protein n=1 Tax=Nakamurella sp. UYEF19 TaxID=1756392 RepID=UPI0033922DF9